MNNQNNTNWDKYWGLINQPSQVLWEVDSESGMGIEITFLQKSFKNSNLPLIDFGCGDGNITQFLAKYFPQVIGVDVSQNALNLAKIRTKKAGLDIKYQVIDTDENIKQIHEDIGDSNVYMRSVLHQIEPEKRILFVENLKTLIGQKGTLFLMEITTQAEDRFPEGTAIDNPSQIRRLLDCGVKPDHVKLEELQNLFSSSNFSILEVDKVLMPMNATIKGETAVMDYLYAVISTAN
ncbi:class I SAM-dependent methyltransferase [Crocosphaera sp. XPORK-15E]|uniref:class I SAM-dependent methyltransferase n=1 Tax=Crocosphaera sp. XPORK-15E TaxID=3110247 RepID=UPI002B209E66|nr:class I SAM-dependent methyltransferase [Crocosphaera sp. XPORK-15E]MEA5536736.1 class I SAM-dependent methyltransferase [Crocosphaera sp. XPORK-15E]